MDIKLDVDMEGVNKMVEEELNRVKLLTVRALKRLGEESVTKAKDRPEAESWYNDTGNLRSSIGYTVTSGSEIEALSAFTPVLNGSEGASIGKAFAEELAQSEESEFALIVSAGMNYAGYVEAIDGKDVLKSAELLAREKWREYSRRLQQQINE